MDGFSIAAAAVPLAVSIMTLSQTIVGFITTTRDAREDMNAFLDTLSSISLCLESMKDADTEQNYPREIRPRLVEILQRCESQSLKMTALLNKLQSGNMGRRIQWTLVSKDEACRIREHLDAQLSALNIAVSFSNLQATRKVQSDTASIRRTARVIPQIQQDTAQVVEIRKEIQELRSCLIGQSQRFNLPLLRFLNDAYSYTESIVDAMDQDMRADIQDISDISEEEDRSFVEAPAYPYSSQTPHSSLHFPSVPQTSHPTPREAPTEAHSIRDKNQHGEDVDHSSNTSGETEPPEQNEWVDKYQILRASRSPQPNTEKVNLPLPKTFRVPPSQRKKKNLDVPAKRSSVPRANRIGPPTLSLPLMIERHDQLQMDIEDQLRKILFRASEGKSEQIVTSEMTVNSVKQSELTDIHKKNRPYLKQSSNDGNRFTSVEMLPEFSREKWILHMQCAYKIMHSNSRADLDNIVKLLIEAFKTSETSQEAKNRWQNRDSKAYSDAYLLIIGWRFFNWRNIDHKHQRRSLNIHPWEAALMLKRQIRSFEDRSFCVFLLDGLRNSDVNLTPCLTMAVNVGWLDMIRLLRQYCRICRHSDKSRLDVGMTNGLCLLMWRVWHRKITSSKSNGKEALRDERFWRNPDKQPKHKVTMECTLVEMWSAQDKCKTLSYPMKKPWQSFPTYTGETPFMVEFRAAVKWFAHFLQVLKKSVADDEGDITMRDVWTTPDFAECQKTVSSYFTHRKDEQVDTGDEVVWKSVLDSGVEYDLLVLE